MSAPTRGMVAGQAIQTQAQSKEWDEGFDRTFGERKRERGRFVYREGQGMVRVGEDWTDAERRAQTLTEGLVHGSNVAQDGTDISSRKKRREYMKETGVADASDYQGQYWKKKVAERVAFNTGAPQKQTREWVAESLYKLRKP